MHTHYGLKHFLAENERLGLKYIFKDVTKFPTINQEAGVILRQTLPNGVTRLQFPREAFSRQGWKSPKLSSSPNRIAGVKSFYPQHFDLSDLTHIASKVNIGQTFPGYGSTYYKGVKLKVGIDEHKMIRTIFPD